MTDDQLTAYSARLDAIEARLEAIQALCQQRLVVPARVAEGLQAINERLDRIEQRHSPAPVSRIREALSILMGQPSASKAPPAPQPSDWVS